MRSLRHEDADERHVRGLMLHAASVDIRAPSFPIRFRHDDPSIVFHRGEHFESVLAMLQRHDTASVVAFLFRHRRVDPRVFAKISLGRHLLEHFIRCVAEANAVRDEGAVDDIFVFEETSAAKLRDELPAGRRFVEHRAEAVLHVEKREERFLQIVDAIERHRLMRAPERKRREQRLVRHRRVAAHIFEPVQRRRSGQHRE